jgi:hypothetical protein
MGRRLFAALIALAVAAGSPALCAGWMPTPEARMACCADHGSCPMHEPGSERVGTPHVLTQAEADDCCAASEPRESSPSPSSTAFVTAFGPVLSPVPALLAEPASLGKISRASVLIPITHVPKHLLLSVFLL